jgi:hypothetical protein
MTAQAEVERPGMDKCGTLYVGQSLVDKTQSLVTGIESTVKRVSKIKFANACNVFLVRYSKNA